MRKGIILDIDQVSGFGVIKDENEQDIRFVISHHQNALKCGDAVSFEITMSGQGLIARSIAKIPYSELVFAFTGFQAKPYLD